MKAFEIEVEGKKLDYRVGQAVDLDDARKFFEQRYHVIDLEQRGRHVLGTVEIEGQELFLKLATSEGISHLTKAEYTWNELYNQKVSRNTYPYWVPQNYDSGTYQDTLFYLVTDKFTGSLLADRPERSSNESIRRLLPSIIEFSELIQNLTISIPGREENHQAFFRAKAHSWYQAIPEDISENHNVSSLLTLVEESYKTLDRKTRHGDFTPWHLLSLPDNTLGLIDGEHAMGSGVEYYDIAYLVQRIYCVLEDMRIAEDLVTTVLERGYDRQKLKTVLAARGIGGFLDESLKQSPDYTLQDSYKNFTLSL